ncbi:hypothetical protein AeMF1_010236 [Aphanomyces euteiches]|nr:hypothetical protein AeMF1_010236 [Aphanomyces euteiches]
MQSTEAVKSHIHPSCRVHVGQIPPWLLVEQKARDYFDKYGRVTAIDIHRDPRDTQACGFCYVTYASPEEATKAVASLQEELAKNESQLEAHVAFTRGAVDAKNLVSEETTDKLAYVSQRQPSQMTEEDEDDRLLFSLSQRSSQGMSMRHSYLH